MRHRKQYTLDIGPTVQASIGSVIFKNLFEYLMQIKQISSIYETYGKSNGNSRIQVGTMLLCMTVTIAKYLPRASDYTAAGLPRDI